MIGVFDSGSGGITILKALRDRLPEEDFLYLGDHANAPYGHRENSQIVDLTREGVDLLMKRGCSLVIFACNTAAAIALRHLQQNWLHDAYPENRILGVLVPMVEAVTGVPWHHEAPSHKAEKTRSILLFATRKTIQSRSYHDEVEKRSPGIELIDKPCPGLVDAIEGGAGKSPISGLVTGYVEEALEIIPSPDAIILGCTHFPLVSNHFAYALPAGVPIFSQPDIVADKLVDYLVRHKDLSKKGSGNLEMLTTGDPESVNRLSAFLPEEYRIFKGAN